MSDEFKIPPAEFPDGNAVVEKLLRIQEAMLAEGGGDGGTTRLAIPPNVIKAMADIATNAWRAKEKMTDAATGEVKEDMKRAHRHIEAIYRNLAEVDIEIRDHTGDVYDEGQPMKVIASKPKPDLDRKRVSETLLPTVFWQNRLIQNGEIEIATPLTPTQPQQ